MNTFSNQRLANYVSTAFHSFDLHALTIDSVRAHQWLQSELLNEWHELNQPEVRQARH